MLRIYHDYLRELVEQKDAPAIAAEVQRYEEMFPQVRKEIDDLRNDLHLLKMKFASFAREDKPFDSDLYKSTTHGTVQKKLLAFRKTFDKLRKELDLLENG
jgi:septal ring factor EnvC (AmiA/AmiB activator)